MENILITGGTGLIGTHLSKMLTDKKFSVSILSREKRNVGSKIQTYYWDIKKGEIDEEALMNADYIINLAGASIAGGRWTKKRKDEIYNSRIEGTRLLAKKLKEAKHHVKGVISASAVGYYGNGGSQWLMEDAPSGNDFLAHVCRDWEAQSMSIAEQGIRTVILRTGIVLAKEGGALPELAKTMKFGIATYLGDGSQYFSWIHLDDICRVYTFAIQDKGISGIYNAVSPEPVTNRELTLAIKEAKESLSIVMPVPAFALKLALGEMSETLLSGVRCSCAKLQKTGFNFKFTHLKDALTN